MDILFYFLFLSLVLQSSQKFVFKVFHKATLRNKKIVFLDKFAFNPGKGSFRVSAKFNENLNEKDPGNNLPDFY